MSLLKNIHEQGLTEKNNNLVIDKPFVYHFDSTDELSHQDEKDLNILIDLGFLIINPYGYYSIYFNEDDFERLGFYLHLTALR